MNGRGRAVLGATAVGAVAIALLLFRLTSGERTTIDSESIVMLGDSITEEGLWSDLFPTGNLVNQGHSGFTTEQLVPIARQVAEGQPRLVFILTGTNDIRDDHPPSWTVNHLNDILDTIAADAPDTEVILQTILPRADRVPDVLAANDALTTLAAQRGLPLLDAHRDFDDGRGGLRADETYDGIHLTEAGYARWKNLLQPFIDSGS